MGVDLDQSLYALDSTTIDLCLACFPGPASGGARQRSRCTRWWTCTAIFPAFVHITDGKVHDVYVLDQIVPEAGAFYVVDRGYIDFERLFVLALSAALFLVGTKSKTGKRLKFLTNNFGLPALTNRPDLQAALASGTLLQMDQAALADRGFLRHQRERGQDGFYRFSA